MSDWDAFEQGFAYWFGSAVAVVVVLYVAWCLCLGTLMFVNGLQDRIDRRRAARQAAADRAAGRKPLQWETTVRTTSSCVVIVLREVIRNGLGRVVQYDDTELSRVPVDRGDPATAREEIRAALEHARGIAGLLNDPTGPGDISDAERIVAEWSPPDGSAPVDVA